MALQARAAITQGVQIGVETTEGTAVSANKKLQSIGFELGIGNEIAGYRPSGSKYKTIHAMGKEWTTGKITGQPSYEELSHLFCGVLKNVTPAQQAATTAYKWTFEPAASTTDTVKTYTIEQGDSTKAQKAAGCRINSVTMPFSRNETTISGDLFGVAMSDDITMTGSPTMLGQVPLLPADIAVFLDSTSGALGTTRLTNVLSGEITIGDRFTQLWTVNDALTSYATAIEKEPTASVKLKMNADDDALALRAVAQGGDTRFLRIKWTSDDEAGTGYPYSLTCDFAVQVAKINEFSVDDDVYAIGYELAIVNDSTWGKPMSVALINKQTAL